MSINFWLYKVAQLDGLLIFLDLLSEKRKNILKKNNNKQTINSHNSLKKKKKTCNISFSTSLELDQSTHKLVVFKTFKLTIFRQKKKISPEEKKITQTSLFQVMYEKKKKILKVIYFLLFFSI